MQITPEQLEQAKREPVTVTDENGTTYTLLIDVRHKQRDNMLALIGAIIDEAATKHSQWLPSDSLNNRLHRLLNNLEDRRRNDISNTLKLRDFIDRALHAVELNLDSILMAATHSEKDARIRGLRDVIARQLDRISEYSNDLIQRYSYWAYDAGRSESAYHHNLRRVWELEKQVESLREDKAMLEAAARAADANKPAAPLSDDEAALF